MSRSTCNEKPGARAIDWQQVRLVVFDMDGTLYDQAPVRRSMGTALLRAAVRTRSLRSVRIVRTFRQMVEVQARAGGAEAMGTAAYITASRCGCSVDEVLGTVEEWMHRRPIDRIRKHRAHGIADIFEALRSSGRFVAVWSDYPLARKLSALGLEADASRWCGDGRVTRLKPDPQGLRSILDELAIDARHALMIGDRFDRDWEPAASLGVAAAIRAHRRDARAPTFWRYDEAIFAPLLGAKRAYGAA